MKVLHITTGLGDGGAEAILRRLILADQEDTHEVISLTGPGVSGPLFEQSGIRVSTLGMPRGRITPSGVRQLYRLIRASRPDVIQTWMYHADLFGGAMGRLFGRTAVVWGVHCSDLSPAKTAVTTRVVAHLCAALSRVVPDKVICCSTAASDLHRTIGYAGGRLNVVPNGVDLAEFRPDPESRRRVRAELGIADSTILVGMVARWDPHKDHPNLLAALAGLRRQRPEGWACILVGAGMVQENTELMLAVTRNGAEDLVRLCGARDDIPAVMNALDIHVLSSSGESFGNVTIEAMACGTPSVVTSVGVGEFIVGDTGWVVPPRDGDALAGGLERAMASVGAANWAERQRAARDRVVAHFGIEQMVQAYRQVWRQARDLRGAA